MIYRFYRFLTFLAGPLLPLLLRLRLRRGKEEAARIGERLGFSATPRPDGKLLWVHAASMGESLSALPLMEAFLRRHPDWCALITTVTVTSARAVAGHLPGRALHHFAPLDHPVAVDRFLAHWQPDLALWVESELWPNMALHTAKTGCRMFLINARMSLNSFRRWQVVPSLAQQVVSCFDAIFAQSDADANRFAALGTATAHYSGNLKYDTPPLTCDEAALEELRNAMADRPIWLAASTHDGEEPQIAAAHLGLQRHFPDLITILVPRHAPRGDALAAQLRLQGFAVTQRSKNEPVTAATQLYLADTMGELGLFYRLCPIAFVGGSLVAHGGQNVLEAARLDCAVITGPHTHNFTAICDDLEREQALLRVESSARLEETVRRLLSDASLNRRHAEAALRSVGRHSGIIDTLLARIDGIASIRKNPEAA